MSCSATSLPKSAAFCSAEEFKVMNAHATLGVPFRNVNAGNGSRFVHLLCVPCLHPARRGMWIYRSMQLRRCGTKEQVLWRIPPECESAVSSARPHPFLAFDWFPHMLCTPPAPKPVAGAAASLLGPACLSLPKQQWLMRPCTHPLFPRDLGSPTAE